MDVSIWAASGSASFPQQLAAQRRATPTTKPCFDQHLQGHLGQPPPDQTCLSYAPMRNTGLAASSNEAFGLALSSNRTVTALKATAMRDDDDRRPPEAMHADAGNEDKSTSFAKNSG